MKVLGLDVGFAAFGYAVVAFDPDRDRIVELGVIRTEKATKKTDLNASEDNTQRGRLIFRALSSLVEKHGPVAVAVERQSWPRNASATAKVGIAWGALCALLETFDLPDVSASPQDVKKAVAGNKKASKEEVISSVELYFDHLGWDWPKQKTLWEHPADAAATVIATRDSPLIMGLRKVFEGRGM